MLKIVNGFNASRLLREARRRRVFRTMGLYIVGAWVLVQIALAAFPALSISESAIRHVWIAAALGLPIAMVFAWRFDIRGGRIVKAGARDEDVTMSLQRTDYLILAAIGVVALAIVAGSAREIGETEPEPPEITDRVEVDSNSVAVLPFVNMSGDPANEYFSNGLTETLLHVLAQRGDLKVASRTSSFTFKEQSVDIREIAAALGVAHVLEGSVQKAGKEVRVTAQLIRANDGFHIWSQNYDRDLLDIFAIQDEIAADVAMALGSTLLGLHGDALRTVETENFSAYDLFLQGMDQQNFNSQESLSDAEKLFQAAISLDPEFVEAKLALARNHLLKVWKNVGSKRWRNSRPDDSDFDKAGKVVSGIRIDHPENDVAPVMDVLLEIIRSFENRTRWGAYEPTRLLIEELLVLLEDTKVDSFLTRVIVQFISDYPYFFNDEAQQLVNEALETDPLNSDLLLAQANLYRISGQPEQARQPLLTALKLDSQNPNIPSTIGRLYLEQYEFAQGLDWLRKAAELDPADLELLFQIALSFHLLDFPEQGNTWLEKMRAVDAGSCLIKRIEVVSADREGDRERVIQMTARDLGLVIRQPQFCYFPVDYYAWNMSSSGRTDEAIEYLASLHPDISDLSRLIKDNRRAGYIQQVRLWLLSELMDPADYREIYTAYEEILFKEYPEYFQMAAGVYRITQLDLGGNRPGAVVMFSSWYAGPKFYDDIRRWDQLLSFPWLEGFRSEPEVAEIIAQYRERFTGYREEVSLMLEGEEWKNSGH